MVNITLAVPVELHNRMKRHSEIRWSEIIRRSISEELDLLDFMNKIAEKSVLSKKDVDEISRKIKIETFKELNKA